MELGINLALNQLGGGTTKPMSLEDTNEMSKKLSSAGKVLGLKKQKTQNERDNLI